MDRSIPKGTAWRQAVFLLLAALLTAPKVSAQGLHFSQYYNAPLLTSPANTGLMSDHDYRISAAYRSQWGAVPVPFNTISLQGDLQVFRARNETNWLGLGAAIFSDKAGDGNLTYNRLEAFAAYHIQLGETQMISFGASVASVQRGVDFSKLSFDAQWDGFVFDPRLPNNEKNQFAKTKYVDIGAGLNYAYFPSELLYLKVGAGLAHINQPTESFYNQDNRIGIRPTGNIDAMVRAAENLIINPSAYYTRQKGASELMYGSMFILNLNAGDGKSRLYLGAYHRWNDAIVGAFGYEWNGLRLMLSYDYTVSDLAQYISHNGAMEFGLSWEGTYRNEREMARRAFICPRF